MKLMSEDDCEDQDPSNHGDFLIRSALNLIQSNVNETRDSFWKIILRVAAPHSRKLFGELRSNVNRIMSNVNRATRGLPSNTTSGCCGHEEEITLHIIRDCEKAKAVWIRLIPRDFHDNFFQPLLHDYLAMNLSPDKWATPQWPTLFTTSIWWIWCWAQ